ncbi:MAG: serine/threonine protein kinase [Symploca sp. SIO2D2]|nr:serine/threonine protein kinase [Symploca sp. SIO2D2]
MELLHQRGEIIAERYLILDILGQGGVGTTYRAQDLKNEQQVALKALSLRRMTDWKMIELFEREAKILAQLHHPAIPRYLDYFEIDTAQDRSFYIVQQLAPGKSLAVLVENGWHFDQREVYFIATQILQILVYLQELTPPIIHRDIKPQNLIRSSDGQVFLVDFGAVQDTYHHTVTGGSTVVGTYGYMAPEQFRGQAVLSTDLYGLGTTLLFLLTRKSPADLPQHQLKIDFRSHIRVEKKFADWLEKMLEPVIEDRFPTALAALAVLQGEQALTSYAAPKSRQPKQTNITLTQTEERLIVEIPPVWLRTKLSQYFTIPFLAANGFLFFVGWVIIESGYYTEVQSVGFLKLLLILALLVILGLIELWMSYILISYVVCRIRLEIDQTSYRFQSWLFDLLPDKNIPGSTKEINQVKLSGIALPLNIKLFTSCVIRSRLREYHFGRFLTQSEKEWLVGEIKAFLEKLHQ